MSHRLLLTVIYSALVRFPCFTLLYCRQVVSNKRSMDCSKSEDDFTARKRKTRNKNRVLSDVSEPNTADLQGAVKTPRKVTLADSEEQM